MIVATLVIYALATLGCAIAPVLEHSMRALAGGMLLFLVLGYLYWNIYRRRRSR